MHSHFTYFAERFTKFEFSDFFCLKLQVIVCLSFMTLSFDTILPPAHTFLLNLNILRVSFFLSRALSQLCQYESDRRTGMQTGRNAKPTWTYCGRARRQLQISMLHTVHRVRSYNIE